MSEIVVDCGFHLHKELGPGLLESVYEVVLEKMIKERGLSVKRQVQIPIEVMGLKFDEGFRADLLVENLLLIELNYIDLVESRMNSFRKKHRMHLIKHDESIVLEFLNLVRIFYYKTEDLQSEKFQNKVDSILEKKRKEDDVFSLCFYAWLKAKLDDTEIYKTSLSIISSTKD